LPQETDQQISVFDSVLLSQKLTFFGEPNRSFFTGACVSGVSFPGALAFLVVGFARIVVIPVTPFLKSERQ
jgi:hypothetical protein